MRINNFQSALLIIALFCCSLKCRKDKDKPPTTLPPITQEGKNTFGCKVNGEIWVPYAKCGFGGNPCGELAVTAYKTQQSSSLPLSFNINIGRELNGLLDYFNMYTKDALGISKQGNKIDTFIIDYVKPGSLKYSNRFSTNGTSHFSISKFDTLNKIISGTFELTLFKSFTDSVKITEGRFDLKFQACQCSN